MLNSWKIGEESYETFINERIKWTDEKKNKHLWINKMSQHRTDILKEDWQAWVSFGKIRTQEEALSYPLTSIPLALAFLDNTLRQSQKAPVNDFLIEGVRAL